MRTWRVSKVILITLALCCIQAEKAGGSPLVPQAPLGPLDYLIICHDDLAGPALDELLSLKSAQGFSHRVEYVSDGMSTDDIMTMIRRFYDSTEYAPLHILLVGSAKSSVGFDPLQSDRFANSTNNNLVPTAYDYDHFGNRRAYDQWYSWIEPRSFVKRTPDIVVGRIPSRSEAELQAYVDKLGAYIADTQDASWKKRALLIAGDKDRGPYPDYPSPIAVNDVIDLCYDSLPGAASGTVLRYSDYLDDPSRETALISAINLGQGTILGLTTGSNVGSFGYFISRPSFDAVNDLSNVGMYPVMFSISCDLTAFDIDIAEGEESLAENLLLSPSVGAIGIVGPSGFSSDIANFAYAPELLSRLYGRGMTRLGNLAFSTAMLLKSRGRGPSDTYNLMTVLGDPGLKVDLGAINDHQIVLRSGFETTDPLPLQDRAYSVGQDLDSVMAGVVKNAPIWGRRAYCLQGYDFPGSDPHGLWVVYDDLEMVIDPSTRFLTFYLKPMEHPEGLGRFSLDCELSGGGLLSDCLGCGGIIQDQYGTFLSPIWRNATLGEKSFFAFDLSVAEGQTVSQVLAGYDAADPASAGNFKAYFDNIQFSSTWGSPPVAGNIEMPANVSVGSVSNVSLSAEDQDILLYGDDMSVSWSVTNGTIVGSGFNVEYHAPAHEVWDVDIQAIVSDLGGNADTSMKNFGVFEGGGGGGCPHLFTEVNGREVDLGAILTRSRSVADSGMIFDALPFRLNRVSAGGTLRFKLQEVGNDISTIDRVELLYASTSAMRGRTGTTDDGRVISGVEPVSPVFCVDANGYNQLGRVCCLDAASFDAYGPGHLTVRYKGLLATGSPKQATLAAGGGGNGIDPPPKGQYKISPFGGNFELPPETPNYISVSVYEPSVGQDESLWWREVAKIAPQSYSHLPQFVNLLPFVDDKGQLLIRIAWTWSFHANDLSFYRFSSDGISEHKPTLLSASHNVLGYQLNQLRQSDGTSVTLGPGEELDLTFTLPSDREFDIGIMQFIGKTRAFSPNSGSLNSAESPGSSVTLLQNSPNPFNSGTRIGFELQDAGQVVVRIFNLLGQEVSLLTDREYPPGLHELTWDGTNDSGDMVTSGIYFYRLECNDQVYSKKMTVLK